MSDPKTTFQFEADIRELMSKMDRIQKEFDDTKKAGAGAGAGIGSSFESLGGVIAGVTAALSSLYVVYSGLQKSVETAAEFQTLETRLTSLYGSVEKGKEAFDDFKQVAATTPYSVRQVVEAGAQLEAFGANARNNIKPVADLAAFMGVDIVEAASAFGRAMAGGVGAADILRERGVLNLVKSFKGIDDLTKLTLPEFRKALQETIEDPAGKIAGSTDRLSKTFTGAVSNMYDALDQVANLVGSKMLPALTGMAKWVGDLAGSILPSMADSIADERAEFNALVSILTDVNTEQDLRNRSIKELQDKYGSYLNNLDLEKSSVQDIAAALEKANAEFDKRIKLAAAEEILQKQRKDIMERQVAIFEREVYLREQLAKNPNLNRDLLKVDPSLVMWRNGLAELNKGYQDLYQQLVVDTGISKEFADKQAADSKKMADKTDDVVTSTKGLTAALKALETDGPNAYKVMLEELEKWHKRQKEFGNSFDIIGEQERAFKDETESSSKILVDNFKNLQSEIESISDGFVRARMNGQDMGDAVKKALEQILAKAIALSLAFAVMQAIPGGSAFTGGLGAFMQTGFGFKSAATSAASSSVSGAIGSSLQKSAPVQVVLQGTLPGQEFYEKSVVSAGNNFSSRTF